MGPSIYTFLMMASSFGLGSSISPSLQCGLNGGLSNGVCECDAPWKGPTCSVLDIKPRSESAAVGIYGEDPNVTSWGGNVIVDDAGLYHLFVSEMVGKDCGLKTWTHNSRIIHATSRSITSAFKYTDTSLGVWAHNAAPIRAPASHKECPLCWYLFHIGSGSSTSPPQNCTHKEMSVMVSDHTNDWTARSLGSLVHVSKSPNGPWTPLPSPMSCNNPAPAFARNGTLFVLCSSSSIWRAENVRGGDWTEIVKIDLNDSPWTGNAPSKYIRVEDPYLWNDKNGNWHLMCHRYDYRDGWPPNPNQTEPVLVSGHAYSEDLYTWHFSPGPQPFNPWVIYENGTRVNYSTFERPHLVFNSDGVPTHSIHGVSPVWDQYGQHHPCEVCPARPGSDHSCVVCKSSDDYSWTYTLLQELNVPA